MKTGMNLLLWTTEVTPEHDGLLDQIKGMGFDAVEVPVSTSRTAPYERLGRPPIARPRAPRPSR